MSDAPVNPVSQPNCKIDPPGDEVFYDPRVAQLINSVHFPARAMQFSRQLLMTKGECLKDIEWGRYEKKFLVPHHIQWPSHTFKHWEESVRRARKDMSMIKNREAVAPGVPEIPPTRIDLLDALIRYCFEHRPAHENNEGIPIIENVRGKNKDEPNHKLDDFEYEWISFPSDCEPDVFRPSMLAIKILCRCDD